MTSTSVSHYTVPQQWIRYDSAIISNLLVEAKTAAGVLKRLPYLSRWIEQAHEEQLRLEAVGTSRIEGAEFTQREQEEALASDTPVLAGLTHSQRQLRAASDTYRWLRSLPTHMPVTAELVFGIHQRIVKGCDDDHCEPGALRRDGANVTFGRPRCRGTEGGLELAGAFEDLLQAIAREFPKHDRIIQAMAAHYHIGAMHPFGDGNGRSARALEAFMLRQAGVNDMVMVSLSNYYYEHQDEYLAALYESRSNGHNLTPFLRFALPAVTERCDTLATEIVTHSKRILYREVAQSLFGRLRSPRRRALAERQLQIISLLLGTDSMRLNELASRVSMYYRNLKFPDRALLRDILGLMDLSAIIISGGRVTADLNWPQNFSESELLEKYEHMPSAAYARHPATTELSRLLGGRET